MVSGCFAMSGDVCFQQNCPTHFPKPTVFSTKPYSFSHREGREPQARRITRRRGHKSPHQEFVRAASLHRAGKSGPAVGGERERHDDVKTDHQGFHAVQTRGDIVEGDERLREDTRSTARRGWPVTCRCKQRLGAIHDRRSISAAVICYCGAMVRTFSRTRGSVSLS